MSKGAQKNFAAFALLSGQKWDKNADQIQRELLSETLIAKAIIFRDMERLVPQQTWYESGYRANIVAYAIAKVVHDAKADEQVCGSRRCLEGATTSRGRWKRRLLIAARQASRGAHSSPVGAEERHGMGKATGVLGARGAAEGSLGRLPSRRHLI